MSEYYRKNREKWKKGGCYYRYKPKASSGKLTVNRGVFIINFD